MKNLILIALYIFFANIQLKAQNFVLVPDTQFQSYLSQEYPDADTVINGDFFIDANHPSISSETVLEINPPTFINDLTGVEAFENLEVLDVANNHVTNLPSVPSTLIELIVNGNQIPNIPTLPLGLEVLHVTDNPPLTSLPVLPNTIRYLSCGQNDNLHTLPTLPDSLQSLNCGHGDLLSLPALPPKMTLLRCNGNVNITSLPTLPTELYQLNFQGCSVSTPPPFPNTIGILNCADNSINSLDSLPTNLSNLYIGWNNLTELPTLPNYIQTVNCVYNNITCLPAVPPSLYEFEFDGNPITCVPAYLSTMTNGLTYPLCEANDTVSNPNNCPAAKGIMGRVFKDTANNCTDDLFGAKNIPLVLMNSPGDTIARTITNIQGGYMFTREPGTYTVSIDTSSLSPSIVPVCPIGFNFTVTTTQASPVSENNDFGVICNGFDLGTQNPIPTGLVFPGQTHQVQILAGDVTNTSDISCATGIDGEITVTISGPVDTIIFNGTPNLLNDSTAVYTVPDFGTFAMDSIKLSITTDTTASVTDSFNIQTFVSTQTAGQIYTYNDSSDYTYPVVNSYDPNKKEVSPSEVEPYFNDPLTYIVYFQNTGNAPAINIRLEDVLDPKLNLNTFQFIASSHYQTYSIDYDTRKLTILFPEIFLVDSTTSFDESIGYFKFKINPNSNISGGSAIDNFVNIFFDFNAPITTNIATCNYKSYASIQNEQFINEKKIKLYPNPANKTIIIEAEEEIKHVAIYSIQGKLVKSTGVTSNKEYVNVNDIPSGIYLVHVMFKDKREVVRFVKE
ncbi:MAG: T9SS type A sorting domain-containing protein [Brumimicrobium sp.]